MNKLAVVKAIREFCVEKFGATGSLKVAVELADSIMGCLPVTIPPDEVSRYRATLRILTRQGDKLPISYDDLKVLCHLEDRLNRKTP